MFLVLSVCFFVLFVYWFCIFCLAVCLPRFLLTGTRGCMCAHTSPGVARVSEGAFSLLLPPTWQGQNINNDRCIIICAVARLRSIWCSRRCAARPRSWARPVGRGRTFSVHFSIYFYTHFLCTYFLSLSLYIYIYICLYICSVHFSVRILYISIYHCYEGAWLGSLFVFGGRPLLEGVEARGGDGGAFRPRGGFWGLLNRGKRWVFEVPSGVKENNHITCYTILYYAILYYTILYYTVLYYTILYYTILYCTIP